ncbi:hypothetical protein A7E78_01560 [Syntrophotalea acetylenivorans]|uniref:Polysaccharide biosynthesis protein n=1 Tax=Syntrophotalea acetylenivorans TaxID=1842532 RepID=A0A1L3GL61_9BACT|nr:oligosaccharide flippase family protein [Syntrophotalea acetylenivorans]APG26662.1 hypothetical protein A7E78_01560 [Syntrophotalea acetylenivorans]
MSGYWKSVATIISGAAGAQFVFFLSIPFLTRLYSPEIFGKYAELFSLASIFGMVVFLGLERALPLVPHTFLSQFFKWLSNAFVGISLIVFFFYGLYLFLDGSFSLLKCILFYLLIVGVGLLNLSSYVVVRTEAFKLEAGARVAQSIMMVLLQFVAAFIAKSSLILMSVDAFSRLSTGIYILVRRVSHLLACDNSRLKEKNSSLKGARITPECQRFCLSDYKLFYTYGLFSTLLVVSASNLPVFLTSLVFSPSIAATFFLALRLSTVPITLIGTSIGKVYFSEASKNISNPWRVRELFIQNLRNLSLLFICVVTPGILIGCHILPFLFDSEWAPAVDYLLVLLPMMFFQFVVSPLSLTVTIFKRQQYDAIFSIVRLFFIVVPFASSHFFDADFLICLHLLVFLSSLSYGLFGFSCWKVINNECKKSVEAVI